MKKTNLAEQLHRHGITHLLLDGRNTKQKQAWAAKHGLTLLSNDARWQQRLEDKGEFHNLLTSHDFLLPMGRLVRSFDEARQLPFKSMVLQVPDSNGGLGTCLLNDVSEIEDVVQERQMSFPLLARQWIPDGLPIGVTLIVGTTGAVVSALRLQVNAWDGRGRHTFFGIQWLPSSIFRAKLLDHLSGELVRLADVLRSEGFRGIANFDLILKDDKWYFIECNPRLSAATPTLCLLTELLHGLSFIDVFADAIEGRALPVHANRIPDTQYEGSTIIPDFIALTQEGKAIENVLPVGCCVQRDGTFVLRSFDVRDVLHPDTFFIYHDLRRGDRITLDGFLGFYLLHHPVASLGASPVLTESGRVLIEHLAASFVR